MAIHSPLKSGGFLATPLKSLSIYKRWVNQRGEKKVIFGEYMLPFGKGNISVGDIVRVTSLRDPPLVYGT